MDDASEMPGPDAGVELDAVVHERCRVAAGVAPVEPHRGQGVGPGMRAVLAGEDFGYADAVGGRWRLARREQGPDLTLELRRHDLVGIEVEEPFVAALLFGKALLRSPITRPRVMRSPRAPSPAATAGVASLEPEATTTTSSLRSRTARIASPMRSQASSCAIMKTESGSGAAAVIGDLRICGRSGRGPELLDIQAIREMVPRGGIEPPTLRFSVGCYGCVLEKVRATRDSV